MKTIYDFKKGDSIVRVAPTKPYSPLRMGPFGMEGGTCRDLKCEYFY